MSWKKMIVEFVMVEGIYTVRLAIIQGIALVANMVG